MRVGILQNNIGWFGSHSGYEQLGPALAALGAAPQLCVSDGRSFKRIAGKLISTLRQQGSGNQSDTFARWQLEWFLKLAGPHAVGQILYGEFHIDYCGNLSTSMRQRIIWGLHLPPSQWSDQQVKHLKSCEQAIVLYQRDLSFFEEHVGRGKVHFVHYGIDTAFFTQASSNQDTPRRLVFSGHYLRNTRMLERVIHKLHAAHPDLYFDLLVPIRSRNKEEFRSLTKHPAVTWHAGLNDEQLRALYQGGYLLLLPMIESGANTAIVESLASGLPIVTTDVGGIRDYGGGSIFPVVANDDDDSMVALVERYLAQAAWRGKVAAACRRFAEENLAWPVVAQRHLEIYQKVLI